MLIKNDWQKYNSFIKDYLVESSEIIRTLMLSSEKIEKIVDKIFQIRASSGRLFVIGIGGSAANASHFVNDLRKLCNVEAYAPTDNVAEITARTNDDGFDSVFIEYLKRSHLTWNDGIFILSVGGGSVEKNVSVGIIRACEFAHDQRAEIMSIVGKEDGYVAKTTRNCIIIPRFEERITPHSEEMQSVICHSIVSHPMLQTNNTTW